MGNTTKVKNENLQERLMKCGFFSPYLDTFGGGERYMLTLASHLSQNHKVDIFWDEPSIKAPISRFLKIDLTKTNFAKNIFNKPLLGKLLSTLNYDLLFVLSDGSVPLTLASKNILHFQVPFKKEVNLKTKLKLIRYQHVVTNSHFTKSFIDKSYGVSSIVIYPPVDIKSLKPTNKEYIILSVGRFGPNQLHPKKQEILIEVFKEIYKKAPKWRLILAGQAKKEDYKYLRHLRSLSKGFGIKIVENAPFEKLKELYSKASVYWHATGFGEDELKNPQKMEHFGISTVEASAAGAVPIVIEKGGQKEIVTDGNNGFLWSTKAQLFEKTLLLIENGDKLIKISDSAVRNSKRFSQEIFFKQYEKIIFG